MTATPSCRPYLPPEWAPQSGIMLTWPHPNSDWAPHLEAVERVFAEIAKEVARREKVLILCLDAAHRSQVRHVLHRNGVNMEQIVFCDVPSNDSWTRDHGPITVLCQQEAMLLDFEFNGWGQKYAANLDNTINRKLLGSGIFGDNFLAQSIDLVLEGGSIEVDGSGTLLTTESCLLNPNRNPAVSREMLEDRLRTLLGINRILWLRHGHLEGDDTDGHIDTLARFCDRETIAYTACDDAADPHYAELSAMKTQLSQFKNAAGQAYRLIPLPWPPAIYSDDRQRLPATYANFLIINNAVLVPVYKSPTDQQALDTLATCFPSRDIIGIDCLPLLYQYGSLHCITMQLPRPLMIHKNG